MQQAMQPIAEKLSQQTGDRERQRDSDQRGSLVGEYHENLLFKKLCEPRSAKSFRREPASVQAHPPRRPSRALTRAETENDAGRRADRVAGASRCVNADV